MHMSVHMAYRGDCKKYVGWMKQECPKSCNFCEPEPADGHAAGSSESKSLAREASKGEGEAATAKTALRCDLPRVSVQKRLPCIGIDEGMSVVRV